MSLKPFEAPFKYDFVDPDTGRYFEAIDRASLIKQIVSYRIQNRLPEIAYLSEVLEHYWCAKPENIGRCKPKEMKRGVVSYLKGGVALLKALYFGDKNFVTQSVADKRAEICLTCPLNSFPDKDFFLEWSDDLAVQCVGERRSAFHDALGNCLGCSCILKAKVWFKGDFNLSKDEKEKIRKVTPQCWQIKE